MRKRSWTFGLAAAMALAAGMCPAAGTNYVRADGSDAAAGADWATAWASVTNALAQANSGEQVWVAAGTYYPGASRTNSFMLKAGVALYGGFTNGMTTFDQRNWSAYETVLSGEIGAAANTDNCYQVVVGASNATLDGFVVERGYGLDSSVEPVFRGAGIYISRATPTIANCTLRFNTALWGGGVYAAYDGGIISNCLFYSNSAAGSGGITAGMDHDGTGLVVACVFSNNPFSTWGRPTISNCIFQAHTNSAMNINGQASVNNCVFSGNRSLHGGALNVASAPLIKDCIFSNNTAVSYGGAIRSGSGGAPLIYGCLFSGCTGNWGGAIECDSGGASISNCVFTGNTALSGGGAVFGQGCPAGQPVIMNCRVYRNRCSAGSGGGLGFWSGNAVVINCTIASNYANTGGGVANMTGAAGPTFRNCIVWSNSAAASPDVSGGTQTNFFSNLRGCGGSGPGWQSGFGVDGGGNIDSDPLYVDLAGGDLHEKSAAGHWTTNGWVQDSVTSPCIDAGDPAGDYSLESRPAGRRINMGAYGGTAEASLSTIQVTLLLIR